MRIGMRRGSTHFELSPAHADRDVGRRLTFVDRQAAMMFLRRFTADHTTWLALRRHVADDVAATGDVFALSEHQVLERVALQLVTGELRLRRAPAVVNAYFEINDREDDHEPEREVTKKWPPDPVVPPEYPLIAWLESNEVKRGRDYLNDLLGKQMFTGFGYKPRRSEVAPEYPAVAKTTGEQVKAAAAKTAETLVPLLYEKKKLEPPKSKVAPEYPVVAKATGETIRAATKELAAQVAALAWPANPEKGSRWVLDQTFLDRARKRRPPQREQESGEQQGEQPSQQQGG